MTQFEVRLCVDKRTVEQVKLMAAVVIVVVDNSSLCSDSYLLWLQHLSKKTHGVVVVVVSKVSRI